MALTLPRTNTNIRTAPTNMSMASPGRSTAVFGCLYARPMARRRHTQSASSAQRLGVTSRIDPCGPEGAALLERRESLAPAWPGWLSLDRCMARRACFPRGDRGCFSSRISRGLAQSESTLSLQHFHEDAVALCLGARGLAVAHASGLSRPQVTLPSRKNARGQERMDLRLHPRPVHQDGVLGRGRNNRRLPPPPLLRRSEAFRQRVGIRRTRPSGHSPALERSQQWARLLGDISHALGARSRYLWITILATSVAPAAHTAAEPADRHPLAQRHGPGGPARDPALFSHLEAAGSRSTHLGCCIALRTRR